MSYNPTNAARWASTNRVITARMTTAYSGTTYTYGSNDGESETNSIVSFSLEKSLVSGNDLSFGNTCSAKLDISLKKVTNAYLIPLMRTREVALEISVNDNYQILGRFYIDDIKTTELHEKDTNITYYNDVDLVCYDAFFFSEKIYDPHITVSTSTPRSLKYIARDVARDMGYYNSQDEDRYIDGFSDELTVTSIPDKATCREMLGYLSGYEGKNCTIKFTGDVSTGHSIISSVFLTNCTQETITQDEQFMDGYTIDGDVVQINRVESGTATSIAVYPSNGSIANSVVFENAWIANDTAGVARVKSIQEGIIAFARTFQGESTNYLRHTPMTVHWRGYPDLEVGDFVLAQDKALNTQYCCIMQITMDYDGGFSETFKCLGETEKSIVFSIDPALVEIQRQISSMEEAIQEATDMINDVAAMEEGTFSLIPNSDHSKNVGWLIEGPAKTTDPEGTTSNYIMATSSGIGFSSNGGSSFNAAAIYIDSNGNGHINGNFITANSITTSQLNFVPVTPSNLQSNLNRSGITFNGSQITGIENNSDLQTLLNAKATHSEVATATAGSARYCTCSSSAAATNKQCRLPSETAAASFTVTIGTAITVKFTYTGYDSSSSSQLALTVYPPTGSTPISGSNNYIYYNGSPVYQNSSMLWNAGGLVSFVFDGSHWVMQDNVAMTLLSDWCMANDRTLIDGANIATGTIEADTIRAGLLAKRNSSGSVTGSTRFDLDNDLIVTSGSEGRVSISAGDINIYDFQQNYQGDMHAMADENAIAMIGWNNVCLGLWRPYEPSTAGRVAIAYLKMGWSDAINACNFDLKGAVNTGDYLVVQGSRVLTGERAQPSLYLLHPTANKGYRITMNGDNGRLYAVHFSDWDNGVIGWRWYLDDTGWHKLS